MPPWPGPPRVIAQAKFLPEEVDAIDTRALDEGLTWAGKPHRSEMIRRLVAYGMAHMPAGWTPDEARTDLNKTQEKT